MRSETRGIPIFPMDFSQVAIAGPIQREEEVGFRLDTAPHLRLFVVAEASDLVFWMKKHHSKPIGSMVLL